MNGWRGGLAALLVFACSSTKPVSAPLPPPPTPVDDDGLGAPAGKRVGPPDVAPVTVGTLRIAAVHWGRERGLGQNGGFIAAHDAASGRELWVLKVYATTYDPKLEEDVQDVFIESLAPGPAPNEVTVRDERGAEYVVDVERRGVRVVRGR